MSQHSSLRIDPTRARHRNVLKRHERIQRLVELEKWGDRHSAFGLPKVKSMKIKVKKVKAEKAEGTAAAPAAAGAPGKAAAPAKGAVPAQGGAPAAAGTAEKKKQATAAPKK